MCLQVSSWPDELQRAGLALGFGNEAGLDALGRNWVAKSDACFLPSSSEIASFTKLTPEQESRGVHQ